MKIVIVSVYSLLMDFTPDWSIQGSGGQSCRAAVVKKLMLQKDGPTQM
jgi:ABC-type arginine transport system ATPase subunit